MHTWDYRFDTVEDWISLVFLFNFILFVILNNRYKNSSRGFIYGLISGRKQLLLKNDSKKSAYRLFEIGAFITITSSLYLLFYFLLISFKNVALSAADRIYVFIIILIILIARYLIVSLIAMLLDKSEEIKILIFKIYSNTYLISIVILAFLSIYYFTLPSELILYGFSFFVLVLWISTQMYKYYQFLKNNIKDVLYLIFYLCTLKVAPWLWVYKLVETRL